MSIELDAAGRDFPASFYETQKVLKEIQEEAREIHEALRKEAVCPCGRILYEPDELTAGTCQRCMDDFMRSI